jgi:hypothetical protein
MMMVENNPDAEPVFWNCSLKANTKEQAEKKALVYFSEFLGIDIDLVRDKWNFTIWVPAV